jgi:hypothetical protein
VHKTATIGQSEGLSDSTDSETANPEHRRHQRIETKEAWTSSGFALTRS